MYYRYKHTGIQFPLDTRNEFHFEKLQEGKDSELSI